MESLLEIRGITKSFFGVSVLKGIDFDLEHAEVHVLLGENGAGKSTLMKIVSGAYRPDAGSIVLEGQQLDLATYDPRTAEAHGIATVYQNFHLVPDLSVAENLSLTSFTRGYGLIDWRHVYAHASDVLSTIDLEIDPKTRVRDLPVSHKQMVEIALALSKSAKVLIMDEPTAALSQNETETLFKAIEDIKTRGIGIIYISHKLEEVKRIGDRITVLRDGVKVATVSAGGADLQHIIDLMIGRELLRNLESRAARPSEELFRGERLRNRNLSAPVSFTLRKNEILGITGLVGSGKTELARAIFGVDQLDGGTAYVAGRAQRIDSPRKAIGLGLGYLPEDRDADGLCLNMGVKENVSLALLGKLKGLLFSVAAEKRTASGLINSIGIRAAGLSQQVKYLSGGNKQKVVFGKWLTAGCKLLILDEPTVGIDIGARGDIYGLIREFVGEENRSVIFISSDLDEVLELVDRILVMSRGRLVAELDPKRTSKQELMQYSLVTTMAE